MWLVLDHPAGMRQSDHCGSRVQALNHSTLLPDADGKALSTVGANKYQLFFLLDSSQWWKILFSKNDCNRVSHSRLFSQGDLPLRVGVSAHQSGLMTTAEVMLCDFWG